MAAITQQKADLKHIIRERVMRAYDAAMPEDKRHLMQATLNQLLAAMTLGQLRQWHQALVIRALIGEDDDTPMHEVSQTERAPADRQGS